MRNRKAAWEPTAFIAGLCLLSALVLGCGGNTPAAAPPPAPISSPFISGIVPQSGNVSGGTPVQISGQDFRVGATVRFGNAPATNVVVNSASQINCVTPANPGGGVEVRVINPDGGTAVFAGVFTYTGTPLTVETPLLPEGRESSSYHLTLEASGGTPPYRWSTPAGALPPGLALESATGLLSGTPVSAWNAPVEFRVTDANSVSATRTLQFRILSAAEGRIIFESSFEDLGGPPDGTGFADFDWTRDVERDCTIAHTGNCSAKSGHDQWKGGLLWKNLPESSSDLWVTFYHRFHPDYQLGGAVTDGTHLFRLLDGGYEEFTIQLDVTFPTGVSALQFNLFGSAVPGGWIINWSDWDPPQGARGRWQCWELRAKLNTPGLRDGSIELYLDGQPQGLFHQLNMRGNSAREWTSVDMMSNVGQQGVWPNSNARWIDSLRISNYRVGCLAEQESVIPNPATSLLEDDFEDGIRAGWTASRLLVSSDQAAGGRFSARADHRAGFPGSDSAEAHFADYLNQDAAAEDVRVEFDVYLDANAEVRMDGSGSACGTTLARLLANDDNQRLYGEPFAFAPYLLTLCLNERLEPRFELLRRTARRARVTLMPNVVPGRIEPGRWHHIAFRARVNSPGAADGLLELWLDGRCLARYTNVNFRDDFAAKGWNQFQLVGEAHLAPSRDWSQYWDNVRLFKSRPQS